MVAQCAKWPDYGASRRETTTPCCSLNNSTDCVREREFVFVSKTPLVVVVSAQVVVVVVSWYHIIYESYNMIHIATTWP